MPEAWMQKEIDRLAAEHGTVPPPWAIYNEHPFSICWRMGGGESHIMLWWDWWPAQQLTEQQKVDYFRQWPPPPCWLGFVIEAIWNVDPLEESAELDRCFEQTDKLGFGSKVDYERDLDDPKWLESPG